MSTFIPQRHVPDPEKRLMVLYAMEKLPGSNELQLLQFLFEYDLSNYIDLRWTLIDLCAQGQAVRFPGDTFDTYEATEAGREALEMFKKRVPDSTIRLIDEHADQWQERFRRERQYQTSTRETEHGEIMVSMSLNEHGSVDPEIKLDLLVPEREIAKKMCGLWEQRAGDIYRMIIRLLSEVE